MADKKQKEEKFYTPEEVAIAVLKKTHELLKASSLFKANSSHEVENGEEPNNDEAEAPEYLANADIENSGAHGEKKGKKSSKPGIASADKDGDGDVDGDDAIEAQEEIEGKDLDGDEESGEKPEHKAKVDAATKSAPKADDDKDTDETIKDAASDKGEKKEDKKEDKKKPPFMKSEKECSPEPDLKKPSLKKFMLSRKMKKSGQKGVHGESYTRDKQGRSDAGEAIRQAGSKGQGAKFKANLISGAKATHQAKLKELQGMPKPKLTKSGVPTSDSRAGEKMSGATPAPTPAEKIKAQPKLQMEKNKSVEKLMGIKPKAGK